MISPTFSSAQDWGRLWQLLRRAVNWVIVSVAGPAFSSLPRHPTDPFLNKSLHWLGSDVWGCSSIASHLQLPASLQSVLWDRPLLPGKAGGMRMAVADKAIPRSSSESFEYSQLFYCWPQSLMIVSYSPGTQLNFVLVWGENNLLYPSPSERGN